ncbi:MAG: amidohydrolase family protein [Pseudomonadota bacterium]
MIDAHHHIWLQKDLPWLLGPERPRIFGPYASIKRDYEIDEYLDDIKDMGIEKSVYVQANWAPNWFEDEVAWVQSVHQQAGWPHAIVGYADFTKGDVRYQLDRLSKYSLFRGVRQQFHWHKNPMYRFAGRADLCEDEDVQRNISHLADYGLSFDLQIFSSQMNSGAILADACPDVTFVLQHAGMLEEESSSVREAWQAGMKQLSARKNVYTKLSAFGTFIHRNDPQFISKMVKDTVKLFGPERCMFGSNFPIEKIWTGYSELLEAFKDATVGMKKAEREQIFTGTAESIYRI